MELNWEEYLKQYDLIYDMPARVWQDGMALGNGSLAALEYEPFHPEWVINKNDVWDYRHPQFKRHSMDEMRRIVAEGKDHREEMNKENLETAGDHTTPGFGASPCPKTCGQLRIRFGFDSIYAPAHRISKRLSLHEGTLYANLDKHLSHPRIASFVCAERDVMVVQVRDVSAMTAFHNKIDLFRMPDAQMPDCVRGAEQDTIWIDQPFHDGFRYVMMARVVPTGGSDYGDFFRKTVDEKWWWVVEPSKTVESRLEGQYAVASVGGDFDIYLTVVTSLEHDDPMAAARERLAEAIAKGSAVLHEEHKRWWADFWPKSYVGFNDSLLEQLWYASLYNLATVLRGTPVGALCGLWYGPMDTPSQILPWMGSYTNDYNMQLPVMPVFKANHPELADGSFRTLVKQLAGAKRNASEMYGLPGAFFPLATDPTGLDVTNGPYRFCQGSGPYWSVFLWWHYLYTGDKNYLASVSYPIMREVATFFTEYLRWHEDEGLYHLEISQNPELMYTKYPDPIDTLSLLKYTLKATVKAAEILGTDVELVDKCNHVLGHYPAYPTHEGEIVPLKGLPKNHINHIRTLSALFPCGEFDPEIAPEWLDMCKVDVEKSDLWCRNYGCNSGWNAKGMTGLVYHIGVPACRLGMTDMAWEYLEALLKYNVKPNSMISHNSAILVNSPMSEKNIENIPDIEIYQDLVPDPLKAVEIMNGRLMESSSEALDCRDTLFPALEGPATYLLMIGEMLMQSQNDILCLFPALPEEQDASFVDLRAEGPTFISSQRLGGNVQFVRLRAEVDVTWRLKNPWPVGELWLCSSTDREPARVQAADYVDLTLKAGEEVVIAQSKENLAGVELIKPRTGEQARARLMTFDDGMLTWLGKPQPSMYYAALEKARGGVEDDTKIG